jgi:hypothetical protein
LSERDRPGDNPIKEAFATLLGMPAWCVRKGHASCLTLEFDEPHSVIRQPMVVSSDSS